MKRLVVKIGTNVLTRPDGSLDVTRVSALVDQVVGLRKLGWQVVIVSSGAVACGRTELRLDDDLDSVEHLQTYQAKIKKMYGLDKFAFVDEDGETVLKT